MKRLLLLLLLVIPLFGQGPPDCKINFSFTATGRTPPAGFPNGTPSEPGCVTWTIVYYNTGFTPVSIELDSAPDSSGAAGVWVAFAGTVVVGVNPNTAVTSAFTVVTGYFPWISVNLATATGTGRVSGTAYGWKVPGFAYSSATFAPSGTQNVNVIQAGGVNVPAFHGNLGTFLGCTSQADVALSGTGYTEIVVGTAAQVIHICKVFITSVSAGNPVVNTITAASGTISTCAGPTERFVGGGITGLDSDWGGALQSVAGESICVKESVANSDKVTITYAKF